MTVIPPSMSFSWGLCIQLPSRVDYPEVMGVCPTEGTVGMTDTDATL